MQGFSRVSLKDNESFAETFWVEMSKQLGGVQPSRLETCIRESLDDTRSDSV